MTDSEKMTLWIGAFRYHLGRQTYAVGMFCEMLLKHWRDIPEKTQNLIRRELADAIAKDNEARNEGAQYKPLGADIDRAEWIKVYSMIAHGHAQNAHKRARQGVNHAQGLA